MVPNREHLTATKILLRNSLKQNLLCLKSKFINFPIFQVRLLFQEIFTPSCSLSLSASSTQIPCDKHSLNLE